MTFLLALPSLPLKLPDVQLDFLAIHEITTDSLENEVALKNFLFNNHFALFPRVNKTVPFDIYAWCHLSCYQVSNVSNYVQLLERQTSLPKVQKNTVATDQIQFNNLHKISIIAAKSDL